MQPHPSQSYRKQPEEWENKELSVSSTSISQHQVVSRVEEEKTSMQCRSQALNENTRQNNTTQEVAISNAHGTRSISGQTTPRRQSSNSADDSPYCRMCLSQSNKASKCPTVPATLRGITIKARATSHERMLRRQRGTTSCTNHREPLDPLESSRN